MLGKKKKKSPAKYINQTVRLYASEVWFVSSWFKKKKVYSERLPV